MIFFAQDYHRLTFSGDNTWGSTSVHPLGLVALVIAVIGILALRRVHAIALLCCVACLIPMGQRLVVASVDFPFFRLAAIAVVIRMILCGEFSRIRVIAVDWCMAGIAVWLLIAAVLRGAPYMQVLGDSGDMLFLYAIGRAGFRVPKDVYDFARVMIPVLLVSASFVVYERITGINPFGIFGGISSVATVRNDTVRVKGAFGHAILFGAWWVTILPLFFLMFKSPAKRFDKSLGIVGCLTVILLVMLSGSSTPLGGVLAIVIGVLIFRFRKHLPVFYTSAIVVGFILHVISNKGLHHILLARFTFVSGSTGYHRYRLIDGAIRHVHEWFLVGGNSSWHWGFALDDVANEYVRMALAGGVLGLALMSATLLLTFARIGRAIKHQSDGYDAVPYAMGLSLFASMALFVGVSYWGQIVVIYYIILGATNSLCVAYSSPPVRNERRSDSSVRPGRRRHQARAGLSTLDGGLEA